MSKMRSSPFTLQKKRATSLAIYDFDPLSAHLTLRSDGRVQFG